MVKGTTCITNGQNELLALGRKELVNFRKLIHQLACTTSSLCEENLDIRKLPGLYISFEDDNGVTLRYLIKPEQLMKVEKGINDMHVGKLGDWTNADLCGLEYDIGFGRAFLESAFVVFEKEKSVKTKMLFGEYKKSHRTCKEERVVLLLFILTCACVLFIVTVTQISS